MPQTAISIPQLRTQVNGQVITPDDPACDQARTVFYGGFDRRPAVVVQAADADDVARVVTLARETGQELAVRSGGHSPAGHSVLDGGIVLDLSAMRALDIDAQARTAWAEPGLTAGEYTTAAAAHGLATGFGDTGSVGIGGITLAGGVGYLVRKHGMTIDDLLAAEVVTADGQLLRADARCCLLQGRPWHALNQGRLTFRWYSDRVRLWPRRALPTSPCSSELLFRCGR